MELAEKYLDERRDRIRVNKSIKVSYTYSGLLSFTRLPPAPPARSWIKQGNREPSQSLRRSANEAEHED